MGRFDEDVFVNGTLSSIALAIPNLTVTNAMVSATAAIAHTKLQHQHRIGYAQPNTAATSETRALYVCIGLTGTILSIKAGSIVAAVGGATVTLDVKKNGTTVLSSVITLDNANTARVVEAGTLSVTALAAGDLLEVVTVATTGGGTLPTGVYLALTLAEDAQ